MRNINEDLEEKSHCDFVTAAYHLLVTGDCFEPLREFLVDQVGERVWNPPALLFRIRWPMTSLLYRGINAGKRLFRQVMRMFDDLLTSVSYLPWRDVESF